MPTHFYNKFPFGRPLILVATYRKVALLAVAVAFAVWLSHVPTPSAVEAAELSADGDIVGAATIEYQIEFGRGVHVQLEADVSTSVTEVRAIFAPVGARRISSYAYPSFNASPGTGKLSANFTINTGGNAYVPPGTEFELFFEVTGADGSVTATETERILYLDPSKDWRLLAPPGIPLDFHYYGFSDSTAQSLVSTVSANWLDIAGAIGVDADSVNRFRAVIYPDVRAMNAVFPPTSAASSDGIFFGGFAMQRFGVFVLGGPWGDSVLHELTHLLVDTKVNSPLSPGVPSWLHEGLAQFFEVGSSSGYTSRLDGAASDNRLLTLRNRNSVPARGNEISLFYTQVGSFVGELIEDRGPEPMAETLRLINDGRSAADAIEVAYGQPLWELENEWRSRLGASELAPPPQPTATPVQAPTTPGTGASEPTVVTSPVVESTPITSATPVGEVVPETGVIAGEGAGKGEPNDGFNWTGPLVGAAVAAVVFAIWSFRVNRRRFRTVRR